MYIHVRHLLSATCCPQWHTLPLVVFSWWWTTRVLNWQVQHSILKVQKLMNTLSISQQNFCSRMFIPAFTRATEIKGSVNYLRPRSHVGYELWLTWWPLIRGRPGVYWEYYWLCHQWGMEQNHFLYAADTLASPIQRVLLQLFPGLFFLGAAQC